MKVVHLTSQEQMGIVILPTIQQLVMDGGIYLAGDTDYANIQTSNNTSFSGNIASVAYRPPQNATILYPNIKFSSTSISNHPLNNYDISYAGGEILTFNVTYSANGGTGGYIGPDIEPGSTDTVLSPEDVGISWLNHNFTGWNTSSDGGGTAYQIGDNITLNDYVTLYAQWSTNEFCVLFESNGGSPVNSQIVPYNETIIRPPNPTKSGYVFQGWYTDDETFLNEWDFNTPVTEDITLYAKWKENSKCCIYFFILIIPIILIVFYKNICKI